ncbi:hypothetical protein ACLOJK_023322 [Asimina triloba]
MDIDWRNIDSRFVVDELYEHINAPTWIDLSDSSSSLFDDDAWFCRPVDPISPSLMTPNSIPDCRHPKTADDFKVKNAQALPLGERNRRDAAHLKRRGILSSLHGARPDIPRSKKTPKKFQEDGENHNPNSSSPIPERHKAIKAYIKSSAEKKPVEMKKTRGSEVDEALSRTDQGLPPPQLKSTLSARNLFAGKDILNQITEFCNELKKLAVSGRARENSGRIEGNDKEEKLLLLEERRSISGVGGCVAEEKKVAAWKEKAGRTANSKIFIPESWKKNKCPAGLENIRATATEMNGSSNGDESFSPVRSFPPTPQRFPSPYGQEKSGAKITSLKPSNSRTAERGILQELEQTEKIMKESANEVDSQSILVSGTEEARSVDMFWFLKPCAYLVKKSEYFGVRDIRGKYFGVDNQERGILQELEQTEKIMKESANEVESQSILVSGT